MENPEVKKREIKALLMASKELKCSSLLILTEDYETEQKVEGRKIVYMPLWRWLLENE